MSRKSHLTGVVDRAVGAYRMWHQKEHNDILEVSLDWPEIVYACGRIEHIIYKSDKWEKDNDFFLYSHIFDTTPTVYCAHKSPILGDFATSKKRSVRRLLKVADLQNEPVAAPYLAKTVEMKIRTPDGVLRRFEFKNTPALSCTLDKKTLLICAGDDIIFINGGKMKVTERGIEK